MLSSKNHKYSKVDAAAESGSDSEYADAPAKHSTESPLIRGSADYENDSEADQSSLGLTASRSLTEGSSASLPNLDHSSAAEYENDGENSNNATITGGSDLEMQRQQDGLLSASQRLMNVMNYLVPVKQTYERLNNGINTGRLQSNTPGRFVGQGTDGVFRNLMAKPDTEANRVVQEQRPPTYEEAAADATPEYWETTMISPMYEDEVFVQGLPVGNLANFVWNVLVTVAFQLVGFILCYLLHTSHAAKQGTRAGLGVTLLMYGYNQVPANFGRSDRIPMKYEPDDPNLIDISRSLSIKAGGLDGYELGFRQHLGSEAVANSKTPYFAYGLIAFGLFIIAKSVVDFYRVKQTEREILAPHAQPETHTTTEATDNAG